MIQLWRVARAGYQNFLRSLWLSAAATVVMTITLTLVMISFISSSALSSTIKNVTDKIDVSIYLKNGTTTEQVASFRSALEADENVASVSYKSQQDALGDWRKLHANDNLLNVATAADLPASLQVKAKDPKNLDSVIAIVNQPQFKVLLDPTAKPSYSGDKKTSIDRIVSFSNFFQKTGVVVSIIFVVISILIIFNTIRMAIFTRRDDIEIMKLVGATKWFIRGPFLFEAALYGVIGAAIALSLSYGLLLWGGPRISGYIDVTSTTRMFQTWPLLIIGAEMMIGVVIGVFSSLLAMSRYLKL